MDLGYIRETAGLPSRKEQEAALRSAGIEDFGDEAPVWIDKAMKRRPQPPKDAWPELTEALRALREGDELVIACAAAIGGSQGVILPILEAITKKGAVLFNAETGKSVSFHPDAI